MYEASGIDLFLSPHSRELDYVYLQDEWSLARNWTLTGGVRRDLYSDFGGTTNPRLALVWEARDDLTAKVMYGTAFRAPSFIEQYASGNPVALGNPALKPERIATLEAGLSWRPSHTLHTSLSLFRHEISDLIGQSANSYRNAGRQHGRGGEFEFVWEASQRLRLSGYYAYQKNIDETTGQDAGYAPHHRFYLRADWRGLPGWQLSTQLNHVADRRRAAGDLRPEIPDYSTVDVTLRPDRPSSGWELSFTVYNLFDADVREPSRTSAGIPFDYRMPGRSFWLQGRYAL
jgi:iron complex outermembrane receptor protein